MYMVVIVFSHTLYTNYVSKLFDLWQWHLANKMKHEVKRDLVELTRMWQDGRAS